MTKRERQILDWIIQDPMVTQETLAKRAGIARSSVAVHVSNLMKKGHIVGKGYILPEVGYVAVAGAVNVDIGGRSAGPLVGRDSNPGTVTVSMGGVGRNIARQPADAGRQGLPPHGPGGGPQRGPRHGVLPAPGHRPQPCPARPRRDDVLVSLPQRRDGGHGPGRVRHGHL